MTWNQLARIEPRLHQLEADALDAHRRGEHDWRTWQSIRRRLSGLVGWWCGSRDMRIVNGWGVAYPHLLACWETGRRPSLRHPSPDGGLPSIDELDALSQPSTSIG
jgi:hypothetical protein